MEPEPSDDDQNCCHEEQNVFEEAAELENMVTRVVDSDGNDSSIVYDRYKAILYKYQEQSQLLDAYLEGIVVPLAGLLRRQAVQQQDQGVHRVLGTCRLLNVLVVVRGYKTVVRFFPHEAADLERVVDILETVKGQQPMNSEEGIAIWEAQTMLLLWLSILILIPFDLATVDSSAETQDRSMPYTPLVSRILSTCKSYLQQPGSVREMSAVILGRLLTRPDMGAAMREFLAWCPGALEGADPLRRPFLLPGILQSLCFAFKLGQRDRLLPFASRAWVLAGQLIATRGSGTEPQVLSRKLSVKLVTRIGLTFVAPRTAPWRYVRGGTSLDVTLGGYGGGGAAAPAPTADTDTPTDTDTDEVEIVEEVEEVVDRLLQGLRDKDTVVRWSAAKGVGRVTCCLPRELGDEVVESVMQLFGPAELDSAWHGGCLALAELARRGLLLPERLPQLMPFIGAALHYDQRRGPHSIGAHVRDAAAYVCWAFARAYDPKLLEGSVTMLASSLLTIACYDREVNCRRAAAAAFQESVGRLGNFPHGISLLTIADYFSVGITQQAYLRVAPQISVLGPEYREPLATHLVRVKARHWEKSLRELAARAAAALVPYYPSYFSGPALDELLPACLDEQLEVRHGAVVMVAELLPALAAAAAASPPTSTATPPDAAAPCWPLSPERAAAVAGLVPAIDKARLYRGRGGEVMRQAVCRLVEGVAVVRLELSAAQHAKVLEALDENLRHPQQYIQSGAVAALRAYSRAYLASDPRSAAAFRSRYLDAYLTRLHDPNVAVRRGYSLALGSLPPPLLQPVLEEAVDSLVDGCIPEEDPDQRDVESRVNCTRALGLLTATMYGGEGGEGAPGPGRQAEEVLRDKVLPSLRTSMKDYTTDNRGDVGSWVREAAMAVLAAVVALLPKCCGGEEQGEERRRELEGTVGGAVGLLLRQSVERISKVREAALRHIRALMYDTNLLPYIPAAAAVAAAADAAAEAVDAGGVTASLEALQRIVVRLLYEPPYTEPLLEGLVASIGGVDNSLAKVASQALLEALAAAAATHTRSNAHGMADTDAGSSTLLIRVAKHLLDIWSRHARSHRLATPLLRTALLLLTKAPGCAEVVLPRQPPPQAVTATATATATTTAAEPAAAASLSQSRFVDHLVEAARAETRGCTDVGRLVDAASLLCHLVPYGGHCRTSALQGLMVLLASRYPKARRHAAEQLYLQLLALDTSSTITTTATAAATANDGATPARTAPTLEQVAEPACDLLLAVAWDGDLESAKAARDELAALLRVEVPKMKAPAAGAARAAVARDENASYQALLDDFARGY